MKRIQSFLILCGSLALVGGSGCSSDGVSVGDGTTAGVDKAALETYAANWDGYVEAYKFESGSDRLRIVLNEDGSGNLQVGDGSLLVPITTTDGFPDEMVQGQYFLWDQRAYPLVGARISGDRLRFLIQPTAPYAAWCAEQTPNPIVDTDGSEAYSCLHSTSILQPDVSVNICYDQADQSKPVDCNWAHLCGSCTCTESDCSNEKLSYQNIEVDAVLSDDGTELEGTIAIVHPEPVARTIRLKRK